MFSSEIVQTLYMYQAFAIIGIIVAIALCKFKLCWLAYWGGLVAQFVPMWSDYRLLSRAGYGYAMSGVFGKFVLVALVGMIVVAIVRNRYKAKERERKSVLFFCGNCKSVRPGNPGDIQGCPNCHKRTKQTVVLARDWAIMTPDQQAYLMNTWEE